jgi:hypothetical protein
VNSLRPFQVFLFILQFWLLVGQFLSQQTLFIVQVQEHLEIFVKLFPLFWFDDSLYFSVLQIFSPHSLSVIMAGLESVIQDILLLKSEQLGFLSSFKQALVLEQRIVLLV